MMEIEGLRRQSTPTMYFVGVSTRQSSIVRIFPRWAQILGLQAQLVGLDVALHAPAETYRTIVRQIKIDPLSLGALVTTHKIDLLEASRDLFEYLDPHAVLCGEISSISKRDGRLEGHAKDPITSGLAWSAFVREGYFGQTGAEVLCLGAGGSATAISVYLAGLPEANRPRRFVVVGRGQARIDTLRAVHERLPNPIDVTYVVNEGPARNDDIMAALPAGSVVINATGMGKDRPGSPVTDAGIFPERGVAWELNYRGDLQFMHQAERQIGARNLHVEDGWIYFLHGWTQVIAQVFHLDIDRDTFAALGEAAGGRPRPGGSAP